MTEYEEELLMALYPVTMPVQPDTEQDSYEARELMQADDDGMVRHD